MRKLIILPEVYKNYSADRLDVVICWSNTSILLDLVVLLLVTPLVDYKFVLNHNNYYILMSFFGLFMQTLSEIIVLIIYLVVN